MSIIESISESRQQVRLQSQVDQLGVLRVVVVGFRFHARIGQVMDLRLQSQLRAGRLHHLRQLQHRELLGELVEDAELARIGRIHAGDFDAANGVANVEEAARLSALAVDGDRMSGRRFNAEAIQRGAEDLVVVEAVDQRFIQRGVVGRRAVDDALIQVGGAQSPSLAAEMMLWVSCTLER